VRLRARVYTEIGYDERNTDEEGCKVYYGRNNEDAEGQGEFTMVIYALTPSTDIGT
jgi:hypothetical protein